ncbi:MAG: hypothetical protein LW823_02535 [Rickettsiales bacterium]|jgi:signal transduction histidine kinase|nr:hypothetical protein [Rickettsiales bacterium]
MKAPWSQPSLSRDFALLAAAILFVLFLISAWVSYGTYVKHARQVSVKLDDESSKIERSLERDLRYGSYLLSSLGKQISVFDKQDLNQMAGMLKSFETKGSIYSVFSFVSPQGKVVVSSNKGVLDEPIDVSDRDYVKLAYNEPWKMQIGEPVDGRVSGRWIIPIAMGVTHYTGKHIGTVLISVDIEMLTQEIRSLLKTDSISFAIVSKNLVPLTEVSDEKEFVLNHFPARKLLKNNLSASNKGIIERGNLFIGSSLYTYYRVAPAHPYIILLGYDARKNDENVRNQLWSRLLQVLGFAIFFVLFLWIMRARMIRPILMLTDAASEIARGKPYTNKPQGGSQEIENLATEFERISDYISESNRVEDELRNKMFMLKQSKEQSEIEKHSKSEFLGFICQELRKPITEIITYSQVMKDQVYGPIENRKYRQCALDIYQNSNHMLSELTELLTFSKTESGYVAKDEKPTDVDQVIEKSVKQLSSNLNAGNGKIEIDCPANLPNLMINEFRLQQMVSNLMQHLFNQHEQASIMIRVRWLNELKDRNYLLFEFSNQAIKTKSDSELIKLAQSAIEETLHRKVLSTDTPADDINLKLARLLAADHQAGILKESADAKTCAISLFFGQNRIIKK